MIDLLRLCRLYYAIPMAFTYALTVYYARGGEMEGEWGALFRSAAALALVLAAAYAFNDVRDVIVDRVNASHRPIAAGRIQPRTAGVLALLLVAAGLALACSVHVEFLLALFAVTGGLLFYDLFSKQLGVTKQVLVAILMTSIYPLALAQAGGAGGSRAWTLAVFPGWIFLTSFGYELLKDIRDIAGDRSLAGASAPVQRQPRHWRRIANAAILIGAALLVGPAFLGCGWVYMVIASLAIAAAFASTAFSPPAALVMVYLECCLVGLAATLDVLVLGW